MFILFGYSDYYPSGGMKDAIGIFESLDAAKEKAQTRVSQKGHYDSEYNIAAIDSTAVHIVAEGKVDVVNRDFITWKTPTKGDYYEDVFLMPQGGNRTNEI